MVLADRIRIETLKVLVGIAWADREVTEAEADHVLGLATQANASATELASLRRALADERRLPGADLAFLHAHRDDVLRAVDELIAIDHRIVADEVAARAAVHRLLERA